MTEHENLTGLSDAQVAASRARYGGNILTPPQKAPLWKLFLEKFKDPLIVILLIAGFLSICISFYEYFGLGAGATAFFEPVGIIMAILLATGLGFIFELKADREFEVLNQVNDDEPVDVIRNGHPRQVPKRDIVVGDIVILGTGCEVPADGELLRAVTLSVDESTLTGEPMCRKTTDPGEFDDEATFPSNHVLRGTKVMEGHGIMRVTAVGDSTENGKVFEAAQIDDSVRTPLTEQLDRLGFMISNASYILGGIIIVGKLLVFLDWAPVALTLAVPVALLLWIVMFRFSRMKTWARVLSMVSCLGAFIAMAVMFFYTLHPGSEDISVLLSYTLQTLMIAVALIVVTVPEGLPMAVTLSLAYSMRRMLKTSNLVRKMHACETMGAATVICTDKTGTLTQNQMQVYKTNFFGDIREEVLYEGIAVNSTAQLDFSDGHPAVLGNPTEGALLLWLRGRGADYARLRDGAAVVAELPFSTERKYMATVADSFTGRRMLYVKGAPEIVFGMCSDTSGVGRQEIDRLLQAYQDQAMRTLGFAYMELSPEANPIAGGGMDAGGLVFMGIAAISDPVRADVPEAVREVMDAGVNVKIVTGDTPGTAKEIGRQIGLWDDSSDGSDGIITGVEFGALSDEELCRRVDGLKIIARARPMDKKRLVEALQHNGEVVAVTGDGTNDAPALKAAHVGLSMGDGTSVAKEASDITIIDNSFSSIGRAVMWGRSLYRNIQRFILFQLTVNVVASLIVLCGAFMGTESPLTVTQMLWVNLIMDTFAAMALASLPPSAAVMREKPRRRQSFIISRAMSWFIAGVGGLLFVSLFGLLYYFDHTDLHGLTEIGRLPLDADNGLSGYELSLFFTIFVFLQFWNMFNARAFGTGRSALHFKGCSGFMVIAFVILAGQIAIVQFGGRFFSVEPLKAMDWLIIMAATSIVLWVGELARMVIKK